MSIVSFMSNDEFEQAALDKSAFLIFQRSSEILSMGNCIDESVKAVAVLSNVAVNKGLSNTVINTYYDILEEENERSK